MENHHDENSRRLTDRKPVQRIQEEEGRTLRTDEEEACQGVWQCVAGKQRDLESENEPNEGVEGKDQELKVKVEEILTLMKEMN